MTITLKHGPWEEVLSDVESVGALVADPPFGERTHAGQRHGRKDARYCDPSEHPILSARGINYSSWTEDDVNFFVKSWSPRCSGWFCAFTSHDLVPCYTAALEAEGRYVFAPVACVQHGRNVRLAGDGPSNWTDYLVVARWPGAPKSGALPGAYYGPPHDPGENSLDRSKRAVPGGKPLWLMRSIIRDYTKPGDVVVDPCCGGGTTGVACRIEGRSCIMSEVDEVTHAVAALRIAETSDEAAVARMRLSSVRPPATGGTRDLFGGES